MQTVYEAAGGEAGLRRLAAAWHERVMADEVVAHAFHGGAKPDHAERLAAYWAEALGGPPDYTTNYGDGATVVHMHSGEGEHDDMNRRAIDCFDGAMDDADFTDGTLRRTLHDYFAWATNVLMYEHHESKDTVPAELAIAQWSWDGLVG